MADLIDTVIKYVGFGLAGGLSAVAFDYIMDMTGVATNPMTPDWVRPYTTASADLSRSFARGAVVGVAIPWVAEPLGIARISPGRIIYQAQSMI